MSPSLDKKSNHENLVAIAPRPLSRLSYKIMSLNILAILVLVGGIAYLDKYRQVLTTAEMETLSAETRLYAAALAEGAYQNNQLNMESAENLLNSFTEQKRQQILLLNNEGRFLLDIRTVGMNSPAEKIRTDKLPGAFGRLLEQSFAKFVDLFAVRFQLPAYPEMGPSDYALFPDVIKAHSESISMSAWKSSTGGLILSSASPIIKDDNLVGLVLVTRPDTAIEAAFANTRLDILKLFLIALTMTITLSLYLSGAIGHPLRKLASAAEAIRLGTGNAADIPDMSERDDEIGELSIALRQMTLALNNRLDSIERFAADVSHELKNPLTSMRSAVETLPLVKSDTDRHRLNEIIMHDLQRLDRLISDISQASRVDAEVARGAASPVDLRDVLIPLIDGYRPTSNRIADMHENPTLNDDMVHIFGLKNPVIVLGHARRLGQVFQNLISNALSFSPPGHAVIVTVDAHPDYVRVVIDDNGPGIPDSKLEKIFERFYSERPSSERFGSHSGLGLSISRQIVEAYGGTLKAENRYDSSGTKLGARFITRLKTPKV